MDVSLTLTGIPRFEMPTASKDQPSLWTSVEFSFAEDEREQARQEVEAYGRSVGVPEGQLDW
jgi:hypothetical protein